MAKKRFDVGSVRKSEKGQFYIKFNNDVTFKKGDSITLYSKQDHLKGLEENKEKMSEESYQKALERIEKIPEWVKFELIKWVEQ
jgi:hypothetical protein